MNLPSNEQRPHTGSVYAVALSPQHAMVVLDAVDVSRFGLRQYPMLNSLLDVTAPSATGCVVLSGGVDPVFDANTINRLTAHFFSMPVIVVLESESATNAVALMKMGVFSVLTRPVEHSELQQTISDAIASSVRSQASVDECRNAAIRMGQATEKEIEVLDLIMQGRKNKEIAAQLGITVRAVEDRRFRLMKKVAVDSVAELVTTAVTARYFEHGLSANAGRPSVSDTPRQCVKGIEVWVPSPDGSRLVLEQGCYRDAIAFRDASRDMTFQKGEGLPGHIWEIRAPSFLKELITNDFVRRSVAGEAGMTTAVGFPVFCQGEVQSIVLLLLDSRHQTKAVFENWKYDASAKALRLAGGTFINCEKLRRLSEFVLLPSGEGLPGVAFELSRPYAGSRFYEDGQAVRGVAFAAEQLISGVALPLTDAVVVGQPEPEPADVFVLLNSESTPMFSMLQLWKTVPDGSDIVLTSEYTDGVPALSSQLSTISQSTNRGIAATAFETGKPVVVGNGSAGESIVCSGNASTNPTIGLAVPTLIDGRVVAVTVFAN